MKHELHALLALTESAVVETFQGSELIDTCPIAPDGCQDGCYGAEEIRPGVTEEISAAIQAGECSGAFGEIRWRVCLA